MDQLSEPESWIPYNDYVFNNVRRDKIRQDIILDQELPAPPEGWVTVESYHLEQNHPSTRVMVAARKRERPPPQPKPPPPPPPPPRKNILLAMAEVHAALGQKSPFLSELEEMEKSDRRELATGQIPAEVKKDREVALSILRDGHSTRLAEIREWYLERFFHLFDPQNNKEHPEADQ